MEEQLQLILKEYIKNVDDVCNSLLKSINSSENLNLKNKYDFLKYRASSRKMEFEADGMRYQLHGKGCMAYNAEKFMDWDFGYRSRWCGINPWKVSFTLQKNNSPHVEYYDGTLLQTTCEQAIQKGIMFKQDDQYYFEMTADEIYKPEFPAEFDTLVIDYFDSSWSLPRNKIIDRFIRKSTWVYDQIDKSEDKYMLRFLLKGKEIYAIPYNDIGYPENAVKIMSDEIIKKFLPHSISWNREILL